MLPGNIPQGHSHWIVWGAVPGCWICCLATYLRGTLTGLCGGQSWLLDMLTGNIPQGHTHWGGVGDILGCWICCLATYHRGTLIRDCVGGIPGCWMCCLTTYLRGTLIGMVWGAFLAVGYAAWQQPQGHTHWNGVRAFLAAGYAAWQHNSGAYSLDCVWGIPGCWICCLATYLRGTLIRDYVGGIPGCLI